MTLKILFWNVRNLSNTLDRPGVHGRGVPLDCRAREIAKELRYINSQLLAYGLIDLVFFLELGSDANQLMEVIAKDGKLQRKSWPEFLPWTIATTGATEPNNDASERVGCLQSSAVPGDYKILQHPSDPSQWYKLVGNGVTTKTRNAVEVELANGCKIAVLHAPSPSYPLNFRLSVIEAALANNPDILCGDLNIKDNEFNAFKQMMSGKGYEFCGPIDTGKAGKTSLRKFTTITKVGDSESQPYDQVWRRKSNKFQVLARIMQPTIQLDRLVGTIEQTIVNWLDEASRSFNAQFALHHDVNVNALEHSEISALVLDVQTKAKELTRTLNNWKQSKTKKTDLIDNAINFLSTLVSKLETNTLNTGLITLSEYRRLKYICNESESVIEVLGGYYRASGAGVPGYFEQQEAIYEFCVSDHWPVYFEIAN